MTKSGMVAIGAFLLSIILTIIVSHFNPQLGKFYLDFFQLPLFIISTFLLILYIIYKELSSFFTHKKKKIIVEAISAQKEEEDSVDSVNRDMYLTKHIIAGDLIEYHILNKKKEIIWHGKCHIDQGKIHSILLFAGESDEKIVLQVTKEADDLEYLINDDQSAIGSIKITNIGLIYNNLANKMIHQAALKTEYDEGFGIVADLMYGLVGEYRSSAKKFDFFLLKDEADEILGKYFIALKNIDLTTDTTNKFDRRIAAIFSILLDHALNDEKSTLMKQQTPSQPEMVPEKAEQKSEDYRTLDICPAKTIAW